MKYQMPNHDDLSKITLESERLCLVPVSTKYTEDIYREFTDEIVTYMYPATPKSPKDSEHFILTSQEKMKLGSDIVLAILLKETKEFLGCVGLHCLHRKTKDPELGIWLKKSAHGHAYGREAVTMVKDWADNSLEYTYIHYPVSKVNLPSRKIAESLGGKVARELKKKNQRGVILDEVEYYIYPPTA